jgi:hypothetical protein
MKLARWIRRPSPVLLISLVALFLAGGGTSDAATHPHVLRLGKTAKTGKGTGLTSSSRKHPALTLKTTHQQPAASFVTPTGQAPFRVSSATVVPNLNADLLDGLDSSKLQLTVSGSCDAGSAIRAIASAGTVTCATFPNAPAAWQLGGNAGTNSTKNFIGTTDNQPLVVKTNGNEAMRVTTAGNLGVGTTTPSARVDSVAAGSQSAVAGSSTAGLGVAGSSVTSNGVSGSSTNGAGVFGSSGGIGVWGTSSARGVVGTLGATSCPGTYAVGGCGASLGVGVVASSITSDGLVASSTAGDAITANTTAGDALRTSTQFGVAVDGFSASNLGVWGHSNTGVGVRADGATQAAVAALGGAGCAGTTAAVSACGVNIGDGVDASSTTGSGLVGTSGHPSGGGTAAGVIANNTGGGDIFIGEANGTHVARIDSTGKGFFDGGTQAGGADYAESIKAVAHSHLHPGDVLSIAGRYEVGASRGRYSQRVIGVYSTRPAVLAVGSHRIGQSLAGEVPVAMMGVVPTKVTAAGGAIRPGDLLTTSRMPGYAMRARPVRIHGVAIYPTGAILGKALQPLRHGRGVIHVLLMSR